MYSGFNGQFLCEYQPWFDSRDQGNNGHVNVGYDENIAATVAGQDSYMISVGCNINFLDFYGTTDSSQAFNLRTANTVYSDITNRTNLKFAVLGG